MRNFLICFSSFFLMMPLIATDVSGNQSGTWNLAGSPYNIVGNVTVPANETLTIEAGVEVVAMGNYKITALGNIQAQGALADTIRFSGNGGLNWGGIRLEDENYASNFSYCRISNTDDNNDYGIHAVNSPVYIDHCMIDDHRKGVQFSGLSTNDPAYMEITFSKVANVQRSGITIVDNSNVLIDNCEITQCGLGTQFYGAIQLSLQSNDHSCSPTITNNYIHHNGKQGITLANLYNYSNMAPTVMNNEIAYNLTGIYLYNGKGYFEANHIHHNFIANDPNSGAGVMLYGSGANAVFTYNVLHGNYTGFYLTNNATANLGDLSNAATDDDGYNCIYDNISYTGDEYTVYNASAMDVIAQNNVWDDDPPLDVTIIDGNDNPAYGFVNYNPILSPYAPPSGINAVLNGGFVLITIEPGTAYPTYKIPFSYNFYRDGDLVANATSLFLIDPLPAIPGTSVTYGASIVYEGGYQSTIVDTTIFIPHILNPPQNLEIEIDPPYAILTWDDPEPGSTSPPSSLGFFTVYLDSNIEGITNDNEWIYTDLIIGQEYTAGVCANYDAGSSEIVEIPFTYNPNIIYNPPQNPVVSLLGLFSWEPPEAGSTSNFLNYNVSLDGTLVGSPTTPPWQFNGLTSGQTYFAEVSTVYELGESDPVGVQFDYLGTEYDPPLNAGYDIFSDHIHLNWQEPNQYVQEYHIYVNGEMFSTTELFFDIYDLISGQLYEIGLTAFYIDGGESDPIIFDIIWVGTDDILNLETKLLGNYPNPFNPSTTISFSVTQSSDFATIEIYNLKGQKIKTFPVILSSRFIGSIEGSGTPKSYSVIWDGRDNSGNPVSSGVYFYQLRAGDKVFTRKMLMMK